MSRPKISCCQNFLAFFIKIFIFLQAFVGISITLHSLWMLNHWKNHRTIPPAAPSPWIPGSHYPNPPIFHGDADSSKIFAQGQTVNMGRRMVSDLDYGFEHSISNLPSSWFIYFLMGVGIILCSVSCIGHIAAELLSCCCLCFYAILVAIMILLEAAVVAEVSFNKHWAEILPYDPTGEFDMLKSVIEDNIDICKWIGSAVLIIQVLSLLLSLVLRAMISTKAEDYDSDEDHAVYRGGIRQPLMNSQADQVSYQGLSEGKGVHSDFWSARMREKYGFDPSNLTQKLTSPNALPENRGHCCII